MPLTRLKCPECGAGLKSSAGFTVGENVCCPKCETYFQVEEQSAADEDEFKPKKKKKHVDDDDDDDDDEWSYKNSWIRYTILGILIVVMCVLAYLLYEKKRGGARNPDSPHQRLVDTRVA